MLVAQNILSPQDGAAIAAGLEQIRAEIDGGSFVFSDAHEDIHLNVEARLTELIGPVAGRLHTARSRNDQVATDFKLWLRAAIDRLDGRDARLAAGADRPRRGGSRYGDAGLHPSADRPAGDLRPSSDGLCRDGRARPRPARRLPAPPERVAARRRGARRHLVPDRPRRDRRGARLRPAGGEFARRRLGPRFRDRISRRRGARRHASVALCRGDRDLVQRRRSALSA